MMKIGQYNTLRILRDTEPGLFLGDNDDNEVLLPNRYVPEVFDLDEELEVFIYLDNEERIIATTEKPYITVGEFSLLRCNAVTKHGAFLDFGLVKELFCPFKEQVFPMKEGGWYLVRCYLDEHSERLVASSKTNKFLNNANLSVNQFDEVDIIISHPSELGMNVIINNSYSGLIYTNNIFQDLSVGDKLKGIVNKIRPGNKIDITLGKIGYRNIEPNSAIILDAFNTSDSGFISLNDKSSPEAIKSKFQMSKKNFKKAIGALYKQKLITIEADGIRLV